MIICGNIPSTAITDIVKDNYGYYYYVDSRYTFDHGYETMVFECDANGKVLSWIDLYAETYPTFDEMQENHAKIITNIEKYI